MKKSCSVDNRRRANLYASVDHLVSETDDEVLQFPVEFLDFVELTKVSSNCKAASKF